MEQHACSCSVCIAYLYVYFAGFACKRVVMVCVLQMAHATLNISGDSATTAVTAETLLLHLFNTVNVCGTMKAALGWLSRIFKFYKEISFSAHYQSPRSGCLGVTAEPCCFDEALIASITC